VPGSKTKATETVLTRTLLIFLILNLGLFSSRSQAGDSASFVEPVLKQATLADFEKQMTGIGDWTNLTGLVFALHGRDTRTPQGSYLIDDIALIKTGHPGPGVDDPVVAPKKQAWDEASLLLILSLLPNHAHP